MTIPNGWREGKPTTSAVKLQAVNAVGAMVLVRVVSKEDFRDFKSFANVGVEFFKKAMPDAELKTEDIQINNKPAIRVSMEGTQSNGQRRGVLLTFFETDANYVDVIGIANASVFKTEEQELAGFAGKVRILAASDAAAPAATQPQTPPTPTPGPTAGGKPPTTRPPH